MKVYRYTLEKYKGRNSRFDCPKCGKQKILTRYVDSLTGQYLSVEVGRCNREVECGYHYKPKKYFEANGKPNENIFIELTNKPEPPTSYIKIGDVDYKSNNLYQYLINRFGIDKVNKVMLLYKIGSSDKWNKSTVFYQIDKYGRCRTGKIMQYSAKDGKRVKKPYNKIAWLHTTVEGFNLKQCFFGEHLVKLSEDTPIGIVESEKTALIMAIMQPEYIWLATGGLSNLSKEKLKGLGLHQIVLFPDSGCVEQWQAKVKGLNNIYVDRNIDDYDKGTDLADLVINKA
ncbi:MAG: DUF6371 domain-containing protein [Salinivirgaceae bacterium]|jgi:hypothetical protein|nr:DUF6371 domain-containing protein [Salinivirgaceae bacterium]